MNELFTISLHIELFANSIIFLLCLAIFFKIKTFSSLVSHKGIEYFQKGFLCFALSSFIILVELCYSLYILESHFKSPLFFVLTGLFKLLGISYLLSSMFSKQVKEWHIITSIPIVMILGTLLQTRSFLLLYSLFLIILLGYISYLKLKENSSKKLFSQIYIIYLLISLSWIIQVVSRIIIEIKFISKIIHLFSSVLIFSYIFYIVYKKIFKVKTLKVQESKGKKSKTKRAK